MNIVIVYDETSCDLVSVFFLYHSSINDEGFTFFDTSRILVYDGVFVFNSFWVYIRCRNLYTWAKSPLVSRWFRMILTQIITWVHKDSHLDLPTKYQYLTGISILIPFIGVDY